MFPIVEMPMHVYLLAATIVSAVQPVLVDRVNRLGLLMFTAFDYKGQGDAKIDKEELCGIWFTFGVVVCDPASKVIADCMERLDRDGSGGIDEAEFKLNAIDYFNSTEVDCRSRCFLGPKTADIPDDIISLILANLKVPNIGG